MNDCLKMINESQNVELEVTALMSGSSMQWSFPNKVSVLPQLLSFKASQNEKHKNVASDKKAGAPNSMTIYPYHNAEPISVHRSQDATMFPFSNRPSNAVTVFQSQLVSPDQPMVGSNANMQPIGGVPIGTSVPAPFTSSVVDNTTLRNGSKPSGSTTQLTMFYAGSVCVYNDISPEKAQAIMLLAGSGGLAQTQNNVELPSVKKPTQTPISHPKHSEQHKNTCSVLPISPIAPTFIPAAVPQARQASLARFLEKRKERMRNKEHEIETKEQET